MFTCRGLGPERRQRVLPNRARRSDYRSARTPSSDPLRVRRAWKHQQRCRDGGGSTPRTVAPGPATGRVPRRGTTSTELQGLHVPRTDALRPAARGHRPKSFPEEEVPQRSARLRLSHMAGAVRARLVVGPVAHAPVRCDRDRRTCQGALTTGAIATKERLRSCPGDKSTGWLRSGESGNSFGIVFPCRCQRRSSSGPQRSTCSVEVS